MRPVGPWLENRDSKIGTVLVRPRRPPPPHLPARRLLPAAAARRRPLLPQQLAQAAPPAACAAPQARVPRLDKRHLPDQQAPPGYRSSYVPGWIGVRTVGEEAWSPEYE